MLFFPRKTKLKITSLAIKIMAVSFFMAAILAPTFALAKGKIKKPRPNPKTTVKVSIAAASPLPGTNAVLTANGIESPANIGSSALLNSQPFGQNSNNQAAQDPTHQNPVTDGNQASINQQNGTANNQSSLPGNPSLSGQPGQPTQDPATQQDMQLSPGPGVPPNISAETPAQNSAVKQPAVPTPPAINPQPKDPPKIMLTYTDPAQTVNQLQENINSITQPLAQSLWNPNSENLSPIYATDAYSPQTTRRLTTLAFLLVFAGLVLRRLDSQEGKVAPVILGKRNITFAE